MRGRSARRTIPAIVEPPQPQPAGAAPTAPVGRGWSDDEWDQLPGGGPDGRPGDPGHDDDLGDPAYVEGADRGSFGRRVLRTLLVAGSILCVLGIAAEGAVWWWVGSTIDKVERVTIARGTLQPVQADLPENILLVGSDSRSDLSSADQKSFGNTEQVVGSRSDTMMVIHVDPRTGSVSILSVPRDLWVTLADTEVKDKINQAFDGGPTRLVRTIQREVGVQINHYVEVDFVGFRSVVDAVGGVPVYVPTPARDSITGLKIDTSGCVNLVGDQALAYVRSRHYQQQINGRWKTDPTADFGRIKRQQGFFRHTLERAVAKGANDPRRLPGLIDAVLGTIAIDDKLSRSDLLKLARQFRNIDPDAVRTYVLPTTPDVIDKRDVLLLDRTRASDVLNRFNGFGPASLKPQQVEVEVGVRDDETPEQAAVSEALATRLTALKFGRGAATTTERKGLMSAKVTVIRHRPEAVNEAQYFAAFVIGDTQLVPDDSVTGTDLVVEPGTSFGGLRDKPLKVVVDQGDVNDEAVGRKCT